MAKHKPIKLKDSFDKPLEEIFFTPGLDPGLRLVHADDWIWRPRERGRVVGAALSAHDHINAQIDDFVKTQKDRRSFRRAVEFNTLPVLAEDVSLDGAAMAIGGKWFLNGAGGTRLRAKFRYANEKTRPSFDTDLEDVIAAKREALPDRLPAATPSDLSAAPTDLVLDCRNFFNFYHFLTETLPQLAVVDRLPAIRDIRIHSKKPEVSGFIKEWIKAIFPDLAKRVKFKTGKHHYDRAFLAFNTRHLYYQASDAMVPPLDHLGPKGSFWAQRRGLPIAEKLLEMNALDSELISLREAAFRAIEGHDWSHLPRRFYVARDAKGKRDRTMRGEPRLIKELAKRGFETVHFERLTPLEQVAIMARAEMMISYHGAGFANMLFAGEDTRVVELGTLQTAMFRWRDFLPLANAAGCRYLSFFADFKQPDPSIVPVLRSNNLISVALSPKGMKQLLAYVDAVFDPEATPEEAHFDFLTRILNQSEDWEPLSHLLMAFEDRVAGSADLLIMWANCAEDTGDMVATYDNLERAYGLAESRPFLLERLVLLADTLRKGDAVTALMETHQKKFRPRHDALAKRLRRQRRQRREMAT